MIQKLINRYKQMRTEHYLRQTCQYEYAFVGMGQHSLTNLYPVLHYLGVPLKYLCVTSEAKVRLIERKYSGVKATTLLDEILKDETVKGVFVSASPSAHFTIASQILRNGKSLFIEKPPCQSLDELNMLIELQRLHGSPVAMVGLQKRYAPAAQLLKRRISKERLVSYDLHYLTGAYPEGDAILDLYIHPLDLVCHLFGEPEILACRQVAEDSYILMLQHPHVVGTLELSTAYTWTAADEILKVCTNSGVYQLRQMEELTFMPGSSTLLGIPMEKLRTRNNAVKYLYQRYNVMPILANNQVYTQGFYSEIEAFVSMVEKGKDDVVTGLKSIRGTYELLQAFKETL